MQRFAAALLALAAVVARHAAAVVGAGSSGGALKQRLDPGLKRETVPLLNLNRRSNKTMNGTWNSLAGPQGAPAAHHTAAHAKQQQQDPAAAPMPIQALARATGQANSTNEAKTSLRKTSVNDQANSTVYEAIANRQEEAAGEDEEETIKELASKEAIGPLPEHGFGGEPVQHIDGETYNKDWRKEYGPGAKRVTTYEEICAKYPDNKWCNIFHPEKKPVETVASDEASSSSSSSGSGSGSGSGSSSGSSSSSDSSKDSDAASTDGAAGAPSTTSSGFGWPWEHEGGAGGAGNPFSHSGAPRRSHLAGAAAVCAVGLAGHWVALGW